MSERRLYTTQVYPANEALPEHLQAWLKQHSAHSIYSTYEWFCSLSQFKKQHQETAAINYYWFFIFDNAAPCIAVALEQDKTKLKIITNFYTPFCDIFIDASVLNHSQAWAELLNQLISNNDKWLSLEVSPLYPEQFNTLSDAAKDLPVALFQYSYSVNYRSSFTDFASYWAGRSSKLQNTYQRRLKALTKQHFRLEVHSTACEKIKQIYWQIYQQSWKVKEPSEDFINWLIDWAADQQKLQLGILYINDVPAAFQLWLLEGKTASIYKLAQDKQFDAFSPGTVLTKQMIEQLSQHHGVRTIDFLLGNDDFKSLWMDCKTNVSGVEIINQRSLKGKVVALGYKLRDVIKQNTRISFHRKNINK